MFSGVCHVYLHLDYIVGWLFCPRTTESGNGGAQASSFPDTYNPPIRSLAHEGHPQGSTHPLLIHPCPYALARDAPRLCRLSLVLQAYADICHPVMAGGAVSGLYKRTGWGGTRATARVARTIYVYCPSISIRVWYGRPSRSPWSVRFSEY